MRLWHILVFAIALGLFSLAYAPAAFFVPPREGFSYTRISGAVWNARIEGARIGRYQADAISWRISPFDLLQGRVIAPLRFSGEIEGDAVLLANLRDRRVRIPNLRVRDFHLDGLVLSGETEIWALDLFFEGGRCARAEGRLTSDVLTRAGQALGFDGPALVGGASCDGDDALVEMAGAAATGERVRLSLRLRGDGTGQWRVNVQGAGAQAQAGLLGAGFGIEPQSNELTKGEGLRWLPF